MSKNNKTMILYIFLLRFILINTIFDRIGIKNMSIINIILMESKLQSSMNEFTNIIKDPKNLISYIKIYSNGLQQIEEPREFNY